MLIIIIQKSNRGEKGRGCKELRVTLSQVEILSLHGCVFELRLKVQQDLNIGK